MGTLGGKKRKLYNKLQSMYCSNTKVQCVGYFVRNCFFRTNTRSCTINNLH